MNGVGWQLWKNISQLCVVYPLSAQTLRRYVKEGRFGTGTDHVISIENEFFVSTLGDQYFRDHNEIKIAQWISARNPAELARKWEDPHD